jgi:hypothetical protein
MKPSASETAFRTLLTQRGLSMRRMTAGDAISAMAPFSAERRAEDCACAAQGDMLLYQWGVYDFGRPPTFQFEIARQFIVGNGEDDEIFQLHFTLHFPSSAEAKAIKAGNRWCGSPARLAEFEDFVRKSAAYSYASARPSEDVAIRYECAG